jgi:hypothetical protein
MQDCSQRTVENVLMWAACGFVMSLRRRRFSLSAISSIAFLCLFAGLPPQAPAQALADLRSTSLSPASYEQTVRIRRFRENRPPCDKNTRSAPLQNPDSTVLDQISSRWAATPLFLEKYAPSPRSCSQNQNAQGSLTTQKMMPANFCALGGRLAIGPEMSLGLSPICWPQTARIYGQTWGMLRAPTAQPIRIVGSERNEDRFQWRPALVQSIEFLLFEHAFRLVDDPYLRYLLFHKPFWHDWLVSAGQFDMSRWGDGDDFLVNYIGHPMQGGVTGNIYIQNDPRARALKFGRSREYWQSRMRAMAWSAVYSAYFEIGPGLSEVAVGNEGGYTYTPGCGHYVCRRPGYKPPTNNTGWVDFMVTPTMGTGLMILEDAIEREIVDRITKDDPGLGFKVLRSTLAPTHSLANMLAGRTPWFRFSDDAMEHASIYEPDLQRRAQSWRYEHRWNAGVHYTNIDLLMDSGCSACRVHSSGVGTILGYRLTNLLYFDSELNIFPGSGSANAKGGAEELLAGVKVGRTFGSWGVFTTMRPGFIHYEKTLVPGSQTEYESANRFAFDAGGVVEYYASSRSTIRFDIGTTLVRYLTGHPDPRQLPDTVLSTDYITTQGNFHLGSGYVFRF